MYENVRVFETEFAGRPLKVETGKMAQLANGSCLISYGETTVFCAATAFYALGVCLKMRIHLTYCLDSGGQNIK